MWKAEVGGLCFLGNAEVGGLRLLPQRMRRWAAYGSLPKKVEVGGLCFFAGGKWRWAASVSLRVLMFRD